MAAFEQSRLTLTAPQNQRTAWPGLSLQPSFFRHMQVHSRIVVPLDLRFQPAREAGWTGCRSGLPWRLSIAGTSCCSSLAAGKRA